MTADSILPAPSNLQSYNRYSYVVNNPFGYTDPTGHNFRQWFRKYDPLSNQLRGVQGDLHGNMGMSMTGWVHGLVGGSIQLDAYLRNHPSDAKYAGAAG